MWPSSIPLWPLICSSLSHLHTPPFITTFAFTSNTIASYCSTSIVCRNSTFDEPGGTYTVKVVTCIWLLFLLWFLSESELAQSNGCARRTTCLVFTSQINLNKNVKKKHKDIIKKWKDTSLQMSKILGMYSCSNYHFRSFYFRMILMVLLNLKRLTNLVRQRMS